MFQNNTIRSLNNPTATSQIDSTVFLQRVFGWMGFALAITAITAFFCATNDSFIQLIMGNRGLSTFGWIITLAPIGLVFYISASFHKLSANTLLLIFILYAALLGMGLSPILLIYTSASIFYTFAVTSGMFLTMAIIGYTTKTDLSKLGSILTMGLIGIIIATVLNIFLGSNRMNLIISFFGVIIFTGLTAYDIQKLKRINETMTQDRADINKLSIMGALTLYLDFINLFLFLLRFLGNRK